MADFREGDQNGPPPSVSRPEKAILNRVNGFSLNHLYFVNSSGSDVDNLGVETSLNDARFYLKLGVGVQF